MVTITLYVPETKSIAPPIPLTNLPGIIQFAKSPSCDTYIPPKMVISKWDPLIIEKLSNDDIKEPPLTIVLVYFPGLIRSASI